MIGQPQLVKKFNKILIHTKAGLSDDDYENLVDYDYLDTTTSQSNAFITDFDTLQEKTTVLPKITTVEPPENASRYSFFSSRYSNFVQIKNTNFFSGRTDVLDFYYYYNEEPQRGITDVWTGRGRLESETNFKGINNAKNYAFDLNRNYDNIAYNNRLKIFYLRLQKYGRSL